MVLFNHATREMTAKIVYYGPGLCGKTTNLLVIFDKLDPSNRGKMLSLATKTDRTLFFDLLPVDIGKVGPFSLKIQLYTVPGQVFYNETRKLVLKGADAVVFVADSQPSMIESNRESFQNLFENLEENQIDPNEIPIVIQYNKRDIPGVLPVDDLQEKLEFDGYPYVEAAAINGDGVMETFKLVSKISAKHLINKLKPKSGSKPEPLRKSTKKERSEPKPVQAEPEPVAVGAAVSEGEQEPLESPFAESLPFPQAEETPMEREYERVEEVSLEQLLEGRDRPSTVSGDVPVPVQIEEVFEEPAAEEVDEETIEEPDEEIEALDEAMIVEPESDHDDTVVPFETGETASPGGISSEDAATLSAELAAVRQDLDALRRDQKAIADVLSRALADIRKIVDRS
ncbi:MAG: GTPase domain-containing protein [Thermoanaerobaculia bacterium]